MWKPCKINNKYLVYFWYFHYYFAAKYKTLQRCVRYFIIFGPKNQRSNTKDHITIKIGNDSLIQVDQAKSLGVILDSDLRFEDHVNKMLQKGYSVLKLIYGNRHYLPHKTKVLLCETLVLSILNYADSLYGPCITTLYARKIQKLQNSCLRLIYGIYRNQKISHKLKEVRWLNMYNRRLHHTVCLFHGIILNKIPIYLFQKIKFRTDVHTLNIRFKGLLTPPQHRTELFKRSFSYQIAKTYNGLNNQLKGNSITRFKKIYKSYLFERQCTWLL